MRLAVAGPFDPARAAGGVKRRIAAAAALPDFEALAASIKEARGVGAPGLSAGLVGGARAAELTIARTAAHFFERADANASADE